MGPALGQGQPETDAAGGHVGAAATAERPKDRSPFPRGHSRSPIFHLQDNVLRAFKTGAQPDPSIFSTEHNREGIQVGTAIATLIRKEKHSRVMDIAVNETLSRTVITSLTVFLCAVALFIWGGEVLRDFSFAMLVGTVFGTYSSVYVASALALESWIALDRRKGIAAE